MTEHSIVSFAEARRLDAEGTAKVAAEGTAWKMTTTGPDGIEFHALPGTDLRLDGFAGSARLVVVFDAEGRPIYDKLIYAQKPGVVIIAWGRDVTGQARLAYLVQARPFARDPERPGEEIDFGQVPMGFFSREDRTLPVREAIERATRRELAEEVGVTRVLAVEIPEPCIYWQDPTFIENGTYFAFAEVELASIIAPPKDVHDGEHIKRVEFLTVAEVLRRIRKGRNPDGSFERMGLSLGPLMVFFAIHPELFVSSVF